MDQVFVFNKSYNERHLEYVDVLGGYEKLAVSDIKREWCYYTELTVDPSGWQAIWKIPRVKCEELSITFPTIVLVYVENVDFQELEGFVKILAVQDDIHLPSKHHVPIIQLWPTKEQDKSTGLNIKLTANTLDMLHFFYTYIFMPWDYEEDETSDWLSKHLQSRLHFYYDMCNGAIPKTVVEHIKSLLNEARHLQARKQKLELEIDDNSEDPQHVQGLSKIHVRMMQIHCEIDLYENPMLRKSMLETQGIQIKKLGKEINTDPKNWLVFKEGKIEDCVIFSNNVKKYIPDDNVNYISVLQMALDVANSKDSIFLNSSKHTFTNLGALQEGGSLRGLLSKSDTIISSNNENIMLDLNGDVTFENLTIDVELARCGMIVRKGVVTLKQCKIAGHGNSSVHLGVIVLPGSTLNMIDCELTGFYTAIVGNSGSTISLKNCEITDVNIGLKIYDNCDVNIENCNIHDCKEYGVSVETNNSALNRQTGKFSLLESVSGIVTNGSIGGNNCKEDVVIYNKPNLRAFTDLFSNPQQNPTIDDESEEDEDMDVMQISNNSDLNNTVIENKNQSPMFM